MKSLPAFVVAALLALPTVAWADRNPDFEDDAKPILGRQPGLIQFIHSHFEVKDTGIAKFPGSDDRPPAPPYIFSARPRGASGPFYLRLLIQPGPAGQILKVADVRKVPGTIQSPPIAPAQISQQPAAPIIPAPPQPAAVSPSSASNPSDTPTSDTPSGPIPATGSPTSLAPPSDPAPTNP